MTDKQAPSEQSDGIAIILADDDWQDVAQCLACIAGRRDAPDFGPDRAFDLQKKLDRQLTARRLERSRI